MTRVSPAGPILTGDSNNDRAMLQRIFANRERRAQVDLPALYRALGDELRIRLAQSIIRGESSGSGRTGLYQPFAAVAPGEYLDYYRDQRTSVKVTLLPVRVDAFV